MSEETITRDDIANKFREVLGEENPASSLTKGSSRAATALGVVLSMAFAIYLLGKRRGKKKRTIVEIKRI